LQRIKLKEDFYTQLQKIVAADRLLLNEPMSKHTTFRIGGPADYLVLPASAREVSAVLIVAREYGMPVTILGNGSNVLVLDKGIRGLVLKFGATMGRISHIGATVKAGAGASLGDVSRYAAAHGLTGLEFAVGIPGSIGGAVFMNAGAYDGEIGCFVAAVTAVCPDGKLKRLSHDDIRFGYRDSVFQHNGCIICEVELALAAGDDAAIGRKMSDYTTRREAKQPMKCPVPAVPSSAPPATSPAP
jgi:UDP-N-acetylmuramate dehydrogenase